jgi:uncharacterized repeat protein (TIGR01451 family)
VYVVGQTQSNSFPLRYPSQLGTTGDLGSFIAKIDTGAPGQGSLVYSSFLGKGGAQSTSLFVDSSGVAYVGGYVSGLVSGGHPAGVPIFPVINGFQPIYGGNTDGYLVRLGFDADISVQVSELDDLLLYGAEKTLTLLVANDGPETVTGVDFMIILPAGMDFVSATTDQGGCEYAGNVVSCQLGHLEDNATWTIDLAVMVPEPIVQQPRRSQTLVNWPGRAFQATHRHALISRTWRTMVSASGSAMIRALAAPYGTTISADAEADGVERDPDAGNNTTTVTMNAIDGAVFTISDQQLFNAIAAEIAHGPVPQDIDFVLPVVGSDGINMTVRTTDGTVGQVLVTITNNKGYLVMEIDRITVNGASAPAHFSQGINRELPLLLTASLDTLVGQQATPGYNLVRVTPTGLGLEVIVEE